MTIYKNGKEQEKVQMHTLTEKSQMHALMKEKGFVKKTPQEIADDKASREAQAAEEKAKKKSGRANVVENLRKNRALRKQRKIEEREYLGTGLAPSYGASKLWACVGSDLVCVQLLFSVGSPHGSFFSPSVFGLYGFIAVGLVCFSYQRAKRR